MGKFKGPILSEYYGIHTFELYLKNLKYTQVQKVIERLLSEGEIHKVKSDHYNVDRHLKSEYLLEDGIRLRIHQSHDKSNGIGYAINPSTLLSGKYQPVKLWVPTPEAVDKLLKYLKAVFKMLGLDSDLMKDLSLSQMDVTLNEWDVDPVSRIHMYRKGIIPNGFKSVTIKDKEDKPYLYIIESKRKKSSNRPGSVVVKAYDKIRELKINHRCPKGLEDETILRFEVSMKREAFLKKLGLERDASLYEMLRAGYDQGEDLIAGYQKKMYPFTGEVLLYKDARDLIQKKVNGAALQEQMLYLLKKTSGSAGVSTAVQKLKDHYSNVGDCRIKKIFGKFDELGISPVTRSKG